MGGLAIMSALPTERAQVESLQRELYQRNKQLSEAEEKIGELEADLAREKAKSRSSERGAQKLRQILSPLHQALGLVFGEIEVMGVGDMVEPTSQSQSVSPIGPRKVAAWASWKKKMGDGAASTIIDILMVHSELNHEQIRIHVGTNRKQTIYDAIHRLNKAGLLNKNGDKFSLKEL